MLLRKRKWTPKLKTTECNPCLCGIYSTWELDKFYGAGTKLCYNNVLYMTVKSALGVPQCTPDITPKNYLIYRGTTKDTWMSQEYVQNGWQREYNGKLYESIMCYVKENLITPDNNPCYWKEVN